MSPAHHISVPPHQPPLFSARAGPCSPEKPPCCVSSWEISWCWTGFQTTPFTPEDAAVARQRWMPGLRGYCGWRGTAPPIFFCVVSVRFCQAQGGPPWCQAPQGQWLLFPCKSGRKKISSRALQLNVVWVETARDDSHKSCFFRKTREKILGCGTKEAWCAKSITAGFGKLSLVACSPAL